MNDCSHCTNFDLCNDLIRKEEAMYSLVELTCQTSRCSFRDIFRAAYMRKFNKDIPQDSLEEDIRDFIETYNVPPYVVDYMVAKYGPV